MWLLLLAWVRTFVFVMWKNGTEPWRKWADVTYISMWRHISILTYFRYKFAHAHTHAHMHAHARQQWDGQGEGYLHYLHCVLCLPLTVSGADQMVVIDTRRHTHTCAPAHTHAWLMDIHEWSCEQPSGKQFPFWRLCDMEFTGWNKRLTGTTPLKLIK